jgi:hypothetical protein
MFVENFSFFQKKKKNNLRLLHFVAHEEYLHEQIWVFFTVPRLWQNGRGTDETHQLIKLLSDQPALPSPGW